MDCELIEVPAGTMEPPEPPDICARRELAEETGYAAKQWTRLGQFYLAPGILDELAHCFLAEQLSAGEPARQPDEQIENCLLSWTETEQWIREGRIQDAKTLATLSLWRMHCER